MNPLKLGAAPAPGTTMVQASLLLQYGRAPPAIDVANTLYKADQLPGGAAPALWRQIGKNCHPFGVAELGPLLFPCKWIDWTAVFCIASNGPGSSQPFQGLYHSGARSGGHPIVAVVQCDWTTVCCFGRDWNGVHLRLLIKERIGKTAKLGTNF